MSEIASSIITIPARFQQWFSEQIRTARLVTLPYAADGQKLQNEYQQIQGIVMHTDQMIPVEQQKSTANLLIVHPSYLWLWQDGEEIAQISWESKRKWRQLVKQFFNYIPDYQFLTHKKTHLNQYNNLQQKLLQSFSKPAYPSGKYEEAYRWLLSYTQQFINPHTTKQDILNWAVHYALSQETISHFSEKTLSTKTVQAFEELCKGAFSDALQQEISHLHQEAQALLQPLVTTQTQAIQRFSVIWEFYYEISQVIGKKYPRKSLLHEVYKDTLQKEYQALTLFPSVNWELELLHEFETAHFNSALFIPYLLLLHHPNVQQQHVHWANSLIVSSQVQRDKQSIFQAESTAQHFAQQQSTKVATIIGDFTKFYHDKSTRGFSKAYEVLTPLLTTYLPLTTYKNLAPANTIKSVLWSIHRLANNGNLCALIPKALLLEADWELLRLALQHSFEDIQLVEEDSTYSTKAVICLRAEGKRDFSNYHRAEISLQTVDQSAPQPLHYTKNCWAKTSWLKYLDGISVQHQIVPKKSTVQFLTRHPKSTEHKSPLYSLGRLRDSRQWVLYTPALTNIWKDKLDKEVNISPKFISTEALQVFQQHYEKQAPIITGIQVTQLKNPIEEIIKYSKQLPVIHKYSIELQHYIQGADATSILFQEFGAIRALIQAYQNKIKQLSKGANERKATFQRIQLHLTALQGLLTAQEQQRDYHEELRNELHHENLFYYSFSVLIKRFYQQEKEHAPLLLPTINFDYSFWEEARAGKAFYKIFQNFANFPVPIETPSRKLQLNYLEQEEVMQVEGIEIVDVPVDLWNFHLFGRPFLAVVLQHFLQVQGKETNEQLFLENIVSITNTSKSTHNYLTINT